MSLVITYGAELHKSREHFGDERDSIGIYATVEKLQKPGGLSDQVKWLYIVWLLS